MTASNPAESFVTASGARVQAPVTVNELAGNVPIFPAQPGEKLTTSLSLGDFRSKRLLFNRLRSPGEVHIYNADCVAGERLHIRMLIPELPHGGAVVPAFAIVAQSLPYNADVKRLPFELPHGLSAVVAPPPSELGKPVAEMTTGVRYYPGSTIETRTLVGGRCYLVVWSPGSHMGKYAFQIGTHQNSPFGYWTQFPAFWWQIRGWFGASRRAAVYVAGALAGFAATLLWLFRKD